MNLEGEIQGRKDTSRFLVSRSDRQKAVRFPCRAVRGAEFYNVNNPSLTTVSEALVTGDENNVSLAASLGRATAGTRGADTSTPVVLLGANFFSNSNSVYQQSILLHELLHVYTNGWSDQEVFDAFKSYGLTQGPFGDTENISAWISTDCKTTPTKFDWWNN
ncbi:MAG: hypothetical protein KGN84_04720 [Acidobacteriota bacterium]|nr:hypothetical protein [Acidobacteriota bacterium]